jgi:hypothetical protein
MTPKRSAFTYGNKFVLKRNLSFVSLNYLNEAVASGDTEKLIRYVRLHFGDGNEEHGRKEIDKAMDRSLENIARRA